MESLTGVGVCGQFLKTAFVEGLLSAWNIKLNKAYTFSCCAKSKGFMCVLFKHTGETLLLQTQASWLNYIQRYALRKLPCRFAVE